MSWKDLFPREGRFFETERGILYRGEAIETMGNFPGQIFDAIITDPPYGVTDFRWDSVIPFPEMWGELKRIRKDRTAILIFGSEPFSSQLRLSNLREFKYDWYWKKSRKTNFPNAKRQPLRNVEIISVFYRRQPAYNPQGLKPCKVLHKEKKYKMNEGGFKKRSLGTRYIQRYANYPTQMIEFKSPLAICHPTQKPLPLLEYLIKTYTNEGDLILDFTAGSGTTLVAAEKFNRRWIGIELEEKYCEIAVKRLKELGVDN
ncbi:MAG: cytosine methyltransferase [Epsilonproteobacteria bacterium]|nr:cytosine methyltransferase [Campylobacterota bacterium]